MPAARREAADALYSLDRTVSEQLALNRLTLAQERSVELARALVGDPQLVLLDEPASGLSEDQREVFADAVSALGQHLPIVLVEHDLALVAKVAKTVIVLVEGAIIYEGDVAGFQRDTAVGHHLRGLAS